MKPTPLSRTSRLMVPPAIRVSLGACAQKEAINIRSGGRRAEFQRNLSRAAKLGVPLTRRDTAVYKNVTGHEQRAEVLGARAPSTRQSLLHVDRNLLAETWQRGVLVVADLQRQLVLA